MVSMDMVSVNIAMVEKDRRTKIVWYVDCQELDGSRLLDVS